MKVLGAHFAMGGSVPMLIAHIQQKARAAWFSNRHIFKARGKVEVILSLIDILIRPAALWGCGTWAGHAPITQAINTI